MSTPMVQESPDGLVYVRNASKFYADTKAHFQADFGVTLPTLPSGANERIYIPGRSHSLQGGNNIIAGGPMPWPQGDQLITNIDIGLAAQAARQVPPPHPLILGKEV